MTRTSDSALEEALHACEAEPIHQLGTIQPHGVALVLNPNAEYSIIQASENLATLLACSAEQALHKSLATLLGKETSQQVIQLIATARQSHSQTAFGVIDYKTQDFTKLDAHLYISDSFPVLELSNDSGLVDLEDLTEQWLKNQERLLDNEGHKNSQAYFEQITHLVRTITGYDNVMIYKFDKNWDGQVIAQSKIEDATDYLGTHFPASDIPAQARALYTRNLVRVVSDVDAPAVSFVPMLNPETHAPLDMSLSSLRSLSPIHIAYLRNMGTASTMTISLLEDGKLWGLIACHHHSPKRISVALRKMTHLLSRQISTLLTKHELNAQLDIMRNALALNSDLLPAFSNLTPDISTALLAKLMKVFNASGIIMVIKGELFVAGLTPNKTQIKQLLAGLSAQSLESPYFTQQLSNHLSEASTYQDKVAGLLLIKLSSSLQNCLIWLRQEKPRTINWAGTYTQGLQQNPDGHYHLSPRESFEVWSETWRGRCEPWSDHEIQLAQSLNKSLTDTLRNQTLENQIHETAHNRNALLNVIGGGISVTDAHRMITYINKEFEVLTGYTQAEVVGKTFTFLQGPDTDPQQIENISTALAALKPFSGEILNYRKDGSVFWNELNITPIFDTYGELSHFLGIQRDVTDRKQSAYLDTLTGLPNRLLLMDRLAQGLEKVNRHGGCIALLSINLDGFKTINNHYGHEVGDAFLVAISQLMKHSLRETDTLVRAEGDEFYILLDDLACELDAESLIKPVLDIFLSPTDIKNLVLQMTAGIGISFYNKTSTCQDVTVDTLIRQADQAMYVAKQSGTNGFHRFDSHIDHLNVTRNEIVNAIRIGLQQEQFELYYQPKVSMRSGKVLGFEALIRWHKSGPDPLPPSVFMPMIQYHPLGIEIGNWVLNSALAQLNQWQEQGLETTLSINVDARQLHQTNFVANLNAAINHYPHYIPNSLELEILETNELASRIKAEQVIESCRELGVEFALDDFGTGYSSITYLKQLPIKTLKIDRSFVAGITHTDQDYKLLSNIIQLANDMGKQVIAEGVETIEQGELLILLGCEHAQGYAIAKPMPASNVLPWLKEWRPYSAWSNNS